MLETEKLKALVSELMQVPMETVDASTVFSGILASSLGRARLDGALRSRFDISDNSVYTVKTFGELCRLFGAEVSEADSETRSLLPESHSNKQSSLLSGSNGAGIAVGVDIQSIAVLPDATDYWDAEFYQQHFTRQEIAYALLQPSPRESFASAWCAKEALRKADSRWLDVDWKLTELTHTSTGKPILNSGDQPIPCSVSLSHTSGLAVAVVAMAAMEVHSHPKEPASSSEPAAVQMVAPASHSVLALALAVVALLISLIVAGFAFRG